MMLRVHPMERPNITDVVNQLQEIASSREVSLKNTLKASKPKPQPVQNNCKCENYTTSGTLGISLNDCVDMTRKCTIIFSITV